MDEDFLDVTAKTNKLYVIFIILLIGLFMFGGYYFLFVKNNFNLKTKKLEIGSHLSTSPATYISKKTIDLKKVKLDLSKVNPKKVGTYKYYATYNGKKHVGEIKVVDTTPPKFTTKELDVEVGDNTFYLGDFLKTCKDYSKPCLVSYKNPRDEKKVNKIGTYNIKIIVSDVYNNKKETEVTLNVVEEGTLEENNSTYDFEDLDDSSIKKESSTESSSTKSKSKTSKQEGEQEMDDFID